MAYCIARFMPSIKTGFKQEVLGHFWVFIGGVTCVGVRKPLQR